MKRSYEIFLIIATVVAASFVGVFLANIVHNYNEQKAEEAFLLPPSPTPTQALPQVMDVNVSVDGWSYNSHWGEMLYQYDRGISFWTSEGHHIYFATYFDFNANSARDPAARPGLLLEGGTWTQNGSEIVVRYSQTYDFEVLYELETGNRTYQATRTFRCLDPDCHSLLDDSGIAYTYEFNLTEEMARGGGRNVSTMVVGGGGGSVCGSPAPGGAGGPPICETINNVSVGKGGTGG